MKTASLLPMLALALLPGCVGDDLTLIIAAFIKIDPQQMCVANPTGGTTIDHGTLDTAILAAYPNSRGYTPAAVIQNNMPERATQTTIERDYIEIQGFEVELQAPPGVAIPPVSPAKFFAPSAAGAVPPAQGKVVGFPEVLPHMQAAQLAASGFSGTIIAHMRPVGTRASGTINGGWADFPVHVCQNCLGDTTFPCPIGGFKESVVQTGGCIIAQDVAITCCDTGSGTVCGHDVPLSK